MKRFYRHVGVAQSARGSNRGLAVTLDGKPILTPGRAVLELPNETLAQAVAAEWAAQEETIEPHRMPLTRLANTAVDHAGAAADAIIAAILRYAETDLLCYRAAEPVDLARRQHEAWQPVLDWAAEALDAPLRVTCGVLPIDQPQASLARLAALVRGLDGFAVTGLADLAASTGSLVLALAVWRRRLDGEGAAAAAMLDHAYQAERWGHDREEASRLGRLRDDIRAAARFLELLQQARHHE